MIKNQWYAVLSSGALKKGKVVAARRFGENLIFIRSKDGQIGCFDHLCAHRKASLSKGWIENEHLKCPFHGIEYDINGKCVYVPSDGKAATLDYARFHLKSYPVREIGDIIFVWYGGGEPDGEPNSFEIITDKSYAYDHMEDEWGVDYSRVIENQLDVSHLPFVHHNTIGRGNKTVCNGPKVVWLDDRTMQTSADNELDNGQIPLGADESRIKETNLTFKFPNMWLNHVSDKIMILAYFVPVDDEHSIISLRFYNKITGCKPIDKLIARMGSIANKVVERQDKRIVETQLPKKTGMDIGENLTAADLPIVEYRTKRRALQNKGEKIVVNKPIAASGNAMHKLTYGLFILSTKSGEKHNGCIINTAMQVTTSPNRIAFAVNKSNYTHDMLMESKVFNISILSEAATFEQFKRFGFQSGRDVDKLKGYEDSYEVAENGVAYITEGTNAVISGTVFKTEDLGTHTMFYCDVTGMNVLADVPSATYEYYQKHIKPQPQSVAVGERVGSLEKSISSDGVTVWRCIVCGFEWIGEELPDDFICPICKHPKADFEKIVR